MTKLLWTIGLFSLTSIVVAQTGSEGSSGGSAVLVEIGGKKLTLTDFEQKRPVGLFQARNAFYQAERKALDEYIDEYLLEQQAQKEKVTVEQLLERHVTSTLPGEPSEEALRVYFEGVDTT